MRRVMLVVLGLVVAVGVGALVLRGGTGAGNGGGATPTGTLPPVPAADSVTADGSIVPIRSAALGVATPGRVVFVAAEGTEVAAGTAVLRLDPAQADAALAGARAALAAAQARATQATAAGQQAAAATSAAQAGVDQATAAWDQARATRDQLPSGAASAQKRAANAAVDAAAAAVRVARAQVREAQASVSAATAGATAAAADASRAQSAADQAAAARADLDVSAPFGGVVAFAGPLVGEFVSPGVPLVRVADPSAWRIQTTDLDETAAARVRVGSAATVTLDAFPGASIAGTVSEIRAYGETYQGNIVYRVVVVPSAALPDGVRWNMTASVTISAK